MPLTGLTGEWSRGADGTSSSTESVLGERTCRGEVNNSRFYSTGKEHNNRSPLVHLSSSSSLVARRGGVHGGTCAWSTGVAHLDQELVFSSTSRRGSGEVIEPHQQEHRGVNQPQVEYQERQLEVSKPAPPSLRC